jgi:hypothetical protein
MTTESTQPQSELGSSPAAGQGQSQGHRRRRRRRKNKTTQASAPQTQLPQLPPQAQAGPQPHPKAAPVRQSRQPRQGQGQGRKKKFFQKGAASAAQPGNNQFSPVQARRNKGRQKGPREFVGPMDHSYRMVNGNVADGPLSTVQIMNTPRGSYHPDAYVPEPPAPILEDAPTRIYCFIEDLFFLAKIHEATRKLGVKVEFVKGDKESVAKLIGLPEEERPALLIFDLNNLNAKPMTLIPKFKTKFKKATSIIGFLNHIQTDLRKKALDVGCDTVMPRAAFSQSLPNLLRRYGLVEKEQEDEEEVYVEPEYAEQPV